MAELFLVRHAQASFGADDYDKLSTLGHQQARMLGAYFAARNHHFDACICGTLLRHQETLAGIYKGADWSADSEMDANWNEFNFDTLVRAYIAVHPEQRPAPDAPRADFYRLLKRAMLAWSEGELSAGAEHESWQDFTARVAQGLSRLQNQYTGQRVLVVSSGGVIAACMRQILDLSADNLINLNLQIKNTAISQFFYNARQFRLNTFNTIPHLDLPGEDDKVTYS